jgi:glycosyltransferase involved in cell wall biosynthesis
LGGKAASLASEWFALYRPQELALDSGLSPLDSSSLMQKKIRVIFISSVRPEPTSAGQIILYRHFCNRPEFDLEVYGFEPKKISARMVLRRVLGRVGRFGGIFEMLVNCVWALWQGRWIDADLPVKVARDQETIVGTVAHGDGFFAAERFAKKHSLPLLVFFQDWWPDIPKIPQCFRNILEKSFIELAINTSKGICVSNAMKKQLGNGSNLMVLYDLPAGLRTKSHQNPKNNLSQKRLKKFKIIYFGNLGDYGQMLAEALQFFENSRNVELQVRGANPAWSAEFKLKMKNSGRWLDFVPREKLDDWIIHADAFLFPMIFDKSWTRRRVETSFLSKIPESTYFAKPIVIWAPEYSSAVQWARNGDKAYCVTSPDANDLLQEIEELSKNTILLNHYAEKAKESANNEFSVGKIQSIFLSTLNEMLK